MPDAQIDEEYGLDALFNTDGDLVDGSGNKIAAAEETGGTEADESLGISDLFDEGTSGTGAVDETITTTNSEAADAVTLEIVPSENGALLTEVTKADGGKKVEITVNPAGGWQLTADP